MLKSLMHALGTYFLLWLLTTVANCSAARVRNGAYQIDDESGVDESGSQRWYFAESPFMIAKKHMSEREINSLLRNAWLG